jgi:hypothetical protein
VSWSAIIAIVIEILKQRAAAGWPLLNLLLERWGIKIQEDADADTTPITVGAAPSELKDQIVAWLESQKAKAGIGMKFIYTILIRAVPLVIDQIWDNFFAKGLVSASFSSFGPVLTVGSAGEDEILVDVM